MELLESIEILFWIIMRYKICKRASKESNNDIMVVQLILADH